MKEKIYTIPVNEAFDTDSECPFCELYKKTDETILNYVLGPSYMEEDIREETNKAGFCSYHYDKMFHAQNRLGVALMTSTHLKTIKKDLEDILKEEIKAGKPKLFSKKTDNTSPLEEYVKKLSSSCYACQRIDTRMDSYFDTFFYLWKTEAEFREKVKSSKGFCLKHLSRIVADGKKKLNSKNYDELISLVFEIQQKNLDRIDGELDWFIQKFDYRFRDEDWKTSKDALERSILKISSTFMD